ncbi:uncharacterized protein L3040_002619 [Drepanopeziza brunnea f. sp. 'multigermtubi']|uniref:C2H2 type zinc finger domain protein n=1 Tax=Marssonina brunnea f. sp. multigermtubi (strain MB_m1) TaxID=1072389 RepID=K1X2Q1_MARBU|nr:C2H2 type zinc finger domain protein [Drepanopeziza brunnea f. sp. 'multigermtubi' MB_m1]EKD19501.1 C2H2 type zinc finger domain protein [Drepanopeziza brunnea f. sp. 'multigermtubi' MB_m1]KAJ5050748.1 hypothetical protein L3040_002619 [Drepanopeziza brunnea f. sp. 'multigermtubi']
MDQISTDVSSVSAPGTGGSADPAAAPEGRPLPAAETAVSKRSGKRNAVHGTEERECKPRPLLSSPPGLSGSRFQCPKCPKTFSRIENLTRHQANHENFGKFPCVVCKKRFTRSDLLNRHRRIHGPRGESQTPKSEPAASSPGRSSLRDLARRDEPSPASPSGSSYTSSSPAASTMYQHQNQPQHQHTPLRGVHDPRNFLHQDGYRHPLQPIPAPDARSLQATAQGLTNLMEAALAPQDSFSSTPVESISPSMWDGFMRFGEQTNMYMGSYDADMSWTLDYLSSEHSPSYLTEQDMPGAYDDSGDASFGYQQMQPQYEQPPGSEAEDAEGEDEDVTDWPDKVERPAALERAPRVTPMQDRQISWRSVIDEAMCSGLSAATIRPMHNVTDSLRNNLLDNLNESTLRNESSQPEIGDAVFPPAEALDYFLRLYIRYIQPRYPVLHLPTFDIYNSPPLMLVAMMFLGSSHSDADRGRFSRLFHEHLRIACTRKQEIDKAWLRNIDNIFTYFLLCLVGTWSGSKHSYEFAEGGRGILVTAARRCRLLDNRPVARVDAEPYRRPGRPRIEAVWLAWIETERRKRLGLSIYIYDCQYPALFNNQPYVSKAETTNCVFPCSEDLWEAHDFQTWKMLVGPPDMPPSTYYLHALNCCLLRKWIKPAPAVVRAGEFGKIVLMYALHTHIFEWRQSTSMLNPTGLMATFGNSANDMGDGLRERRKWLIDGLDSFAECYKTPATSCAASLLHYLGYVSLDVSLSDMHLVAGRSVNKNDGNFAEENLKFWANSGIAEGTMRQVYEMLALCHHCVNNGIAADSSYEIAVCLFTGGMVCWAFAKLRRGGGNQHCVEQVPKASLALRRMGCWRMCTMFGRILEGFEGKMH